MLKLSGPIASIPGLCLSDPSPAVVDRIGALLPKSTDEWELWTQTIQEHRLESQVLTSISRLKLHVPRWVNALLEEKHHLIRVQNRLRRDLLVQIFQEVQSRPIPLMLLNGPAIAREIYLDNDHCEYPEIEFLVPPEFISEIHGIYRKLGFITLETGGPSQSQTYRHAPHWLKFFNQDLSLFLNTHENLPKLNSNTHFNSVDVWNRSQKLVYDGIEIRRLSNEDFILYQCLCFSPFRAGVRELAEVYNCLSRWKNFNWEFFNTLVLLSRASDTVFRVLSLSQSLFFLPQVQDFLESLEPSVSTTVLQEISHKTEHPERILLMHTTQLIKIERAHSLFSLTESPIEKTFLLGQIWRLLLIPPTTEVAHLAFQEPPLSWRGRLFLHLKAPWLILKGVTFDYGWNAFIKTTLHDHWQLVRAWFLFFLRFKSHGLKEKAEALGINFQRLKTMGVIE